MSTTGGGTEYDQRYAYANLLERNLPKATIFAVRAPHGLEKAGSKNSSQEVCYLITQCDSVIRCVPGRCAPMSHVACVDGPQKLNRCAPYRRTRAGFTRTSNRLNTAVEATLTYTIRLGSHTVPAPASTVVGSSFAFSLIWLVSRWTVNSCSVLYFRLRLRLAAAVRPLVLSHPEPLGYCGGYPDYVQSL